MGGGRGAKAGTRNCQAMRRKEGAKGMQVATDGPAQEGTRQPLMPSMCCSDWHDTLAG